MVSSRKAYAVFKSIVLLIFSSAGSYADVIFKDDFETGGLGKSINGFHWDGAVRATVTDELPRDGDYAVRFRYTGSHDLSKDAHAELRFKLGYQMKQVWVGYDLYIPKNYYHRSDPNGTNNNKGLVMLWSGKYSGLQNTSVSFWPSKNPAKAGSSAISGLWHIEGKGSGHRFDPADLSVRSHNQKWERLVIDLDKDRGRWVNFVVHAKVSDVGASNGILEVWKDKKLIFSVYNADNWYPDSSMNFFERGYVLGWANSGFNETTDLYLDNFVISSSAEGAGLDQELSPRPAPPTLTLE